MNPYPNKPLIVEVNSSHNSTIFIYADGTYNSSSFGDASLSYWKIIDETWCFDHLSADAVRYRPSSQDYETEHIAKLVKAELDKVESLLLGRDE